MKMHCSFLLHFKRDERGDVNERNHHKEKLCLGLMSPFRGAILYQSSLCRLSPVITSSHPEEGSEGGRRDRNTGVINTLHCIAYDPVWGGRSCTELENSSRSSQLLHKTTDISILVMMIRSERNDFFLSPA